jgi:nicotinate-nucleotide pyrophosphorylase (carboxylating)
LKKKRLYDYVLLEASGGVTGTNLKRYASSGIDAISIGAITHSVKALDMNQKIMRKQA